MAEKIYPSSKPAVNGGGATSPAANSGTNPPKKPQLYHATRPVYRPTSSRRKRSCLCSCCLWTTFLIIILVFLAAVAAVIFWAVYRPHRPSFTVNSLSFSQFNISSTKLTSNFTSTISARNPNKKLTFLYDPITVSLFSDDVAVGTGSLPGFRHGTKNTTTLKAMVTTSRKTLDGGEISSLKSTLKSKNTLPVKIRLETKVKVKVGSLKTKKVGIRVTCDGIKVTVPAGKSPAKTTTSNVKCKVDTRIKIWKWTF
ncbi:PREDICTED: protein YLS9-like [Ipomoea nil]|uniref:protein YLS9-like n=1 Tax=Ipomoea nil TaxID=35883 RepID=UPI0009011566|nr:PREDICTED: protein YLS9-like [Ipomoea nil]